MAEQQSVLLVGCGNMAGAMLDGWLAAGLAAEQFTVADPAERELPAGVARMSTVPAAGSFDVVVLGIKPQILAQVAPQVAPLAAGATLISILAGVELDVLEAQFPGASGIVRLMPNLSAALGKSPLAMAERGLDPRGREAITQLLAPLGTPEWIAEREFDLVTALAGSGPAFVYRFIDALGEAAAALGLEEGTARRLALATVEGAAALAAASPHDPAELARRVASPGGVTQAGLDALDEEAALPALLQRTLRAAQDRSAEMAGEARFSRSG
jgi:pyrroline-5-carboxylate reductase